MVQINRNPPLIAGYPQDIQKLLVDYRIRQVIDYIQYNNPPYRYTKISQDLDIPLTTVSRYMEKIKNSNNLAFRADYNIKDLELKLVLIRLNKTVLAEHDVVKLPYYPWLASAVNVAEGGSIILYRVPVNIDVDTLTYETLKTLSALDDIKYTKTFTVTMLSKPSFKYYLENAPIEPIKALKINEQHPILSDYVRYDYMIKNKPRYGLRIVKDRIDLFALAIAEVDTLIVESKLMQYFKKVRGSRKIIRNVNIHLNHIIKLIRGSRITPMNHRTTKMFIIGKSKYCYKILTQYMMTYIYAYSIAINPDDKSYIFTLDLPSSTPGEYKVYKENIINYLNNICSAGIIETVSFSGIDNVVASFTIPFTNYDFIKKRWLLDKREIELAELKWMKEGFSIDID